MRFFHTSLLIFSIAFAGNAAAQTTVHCGDSVVLLLNGHKHGWTLWQQSTDQTTWSTAQGTAYYDSLIVNAMSTYYYRAIVHDGTCSPIYSDTVLVTVTSTSPIAKPASDSTLISFTANWNAVAGATTYYLDVATDNAFTSFVSGYKNLQVNNKQILYTVTGVSCNTTYYYRVRVYDPSCSRITGNSNTIIVTTPACPIYCTNKSTCKGNIIDARDNKIYNTVQIGSQCWMAQNLNVGKQIPGNEQQTPGFDNQNTSIEKYCYNNNFMDCNTYGGLYLWTEMMAYDTNKINAPDEPGPQGICPTGWHIPTDNEWKCLEMTLGMSKTHADAKESRGTIEGNKLKTQGNGAPPLWASPSAGTNISGFSALPSGYRDQIITSTFKLVGILAYFWTSTDNPKSYKWIRLLMSERSDINKQYNGSLNGYELNPESALHGLSVRCVKDKD